MITNDTIVILMPKLRISVEILDFVIQVIFLKIWIFSVNNQADTNSIRRTKDFNVYINEYLRGL